MLSVIAAKAAAGHCRWPHFTCQAEQTSARVRGPIGLSTQKKHVTGSQIGRVFGPHQKLSRKACLIPVPPCVLEISTPQRQVAFPQPDLRNGQTIVSTVLAIAICVIFAHESLESHASPPRLDLELAGRRGKLWGEVGKQLAKKSWGMMCRTTTLAIGGCDSR